MVTYVLATALIILGFIINSQVDLLEKQKMSNQEDFAFHLHRIGWEFQEISKLFDLYQDDFSMQEKELFNHSLGARLDNIHFLGGRIHNNYNYALPKNYSLSLKLGYSRGAYLINFMYEVYNGELNKEKAQKVSQFTSKVSNNLLSISSGQITNFLTEEFTKSLEQIFDEIHKDIDELIQLLFVGSCGLKNQQESTNLTEYNDFDKLTTKLINKYHHGQISNELSEEQKIRLTIDTYFIAKYESIVSQKVIDLAFVIETDSLSGQNLYNYEMGRLRYSLFWWEKTNTLVNNYSYVPNYEEINIINNHATVFIRPIAQVAYKDIPEHEDKYGSGLHVIELTQTVEGWKLISDDYSDEFIKGYPYGTDFNKLLDDAKN